ncbi:hypothetical protein P168DRAFT_89678 [Aspergillus campestris IBT 28561]|uniref:Uncharacterized protein n=1 Tax=Aspergillus campestris (strain IBT 28561) TaxID=1392248 RepID=A0A2I1DBB5_ASPC2|nr:uncharacterized protein P168DRAFT_89678 [Aspergillus campestris IBT 28561]PKY07168.1 hypothetical protein P168DRAFT_89678 [Aspergillus campestris IBT 28561]
MRGERVCLFQGGTYPELCCQVVIITTIVPPLMCLVGVVWVENRLTLAQSYSFHSGSPICPREDVTLVVVARLPGSPSIQGLPFLRQKDRREEKKAPPHYIINAILCIIGIRIVLPYVSWCSVRCSHREIDSYHFRHLACCSK